jgi:Ca-activated chloride channel homolog
MNESKRRKMMWFCQCLATIPVIAAVVWMGLLLAGCRQGLDKTTRIPGQRAGVVAGVQGGEMQLAQAAPGSLPSLAEEIWVISRTRSISNPSAQDVPGSGSMIVEDGKKRVPMPLKHTDVKAALSGYIATVKVTQQFQNPYDEKIEAVYVFPLPENAAVNEFVMTIGERRIRGIIRERVEAEKIYREAKQQGYVASLLTQERPNIFTQSVANIEPGKAIDVTIQYFHTLACLDGWYEFVFPMVVGPRFNPPGTADGVGAAPRDRPGASGQRTEVSYLAPDERSGHDIALQVDLDAGVAIEEVRCRSHATSTERRSPQRMSLSLKSEDFIPNKDFVLRYRVAGELIKSGLLTHYDERGGFFTLMLHPPQDLQRLSRQPVEMVFVLDCSGSMSGEPIRQAKAAIARALRRLQPEDSYQLINFSTRASQLGPTPLEASPVNVERGLAYLNSLNSDGGTMMIEGIKAALDFPHDPRRLRFVTFLTDGYIGNEAEILAAIHKRLGASRIFSFGVGSSVNRYLLDGMARAGRGVVTYLALNGDAAQVMDEFFARISHPALTDVQIDWSGLEVEEVFPARVPDLFVGRPVVVTGRFKGEFPKAIRVTGQAGGEATALPVTIAAREQTVSHAGLPGVWARMKLAQLADLLLQEARGDWQRQVKQVALDFNLMSAFTAFVAVDSATRTKGGPGTTVPVAVPVPEGVNHKTTVQE